MAFTKSDKSDAPMRRKGGMHRRKKVCVFCGKDIIRIQLSLRSSFLRAARFFPEESLETVLSTRESLLQQSREQDTWHLCLT